MNVALVEHAEDDVHGGQSGNDEQQFVMEGGLEGQGGAVHADEHAGRRSEVARRLRDGPDRAAERRRRGEVEGDRGRRKLPEMVDLQRPRLFAHLGDRGERHLAGRRQGGGQVDLPERPQRLLDRGLRLEDDAVLVRFGEDGRDDPLAERIVEGVVDGRRRDSEAAGGGAVDVDVGG